MYVQVPTSHIKEGAICINFATFQNFEFPQIEEKCSIFVKSVGKVTVSMLQRNLVKLTKCKTQEPPAC